MQSSFHWKWRFSRLYSTEIAAYSDHWLSSVTSDDSTSKLFNLALCFWLRWLVQVVFFRLNYHHFFFFRLNYYSDFYSSLKLLYVHQMIKNHLIDDWNFLICLLVRNTYLYTFIIYLHLSLSLLYAYISIFISFYDSFSCLNASVLAVLIIISFMNFLILIQHVFWIFVHLCLSIYLFIHTLCMLRTCFIAHAN